MTILVTVTLVSRIPVLGIEAVWSGTVDLVAVCLVLVHFPLASYNLIDIICVNLKPLRFWENEEC